MRNYKEDFPILNQNQTEEDRIIYFDSAATSQKPKAVIQAITDYYEKFNANPHRGTYRLSMEATDCMEGAREALKQFLHVDSKVGEVVFTKNATESLNLVAYGLKERIQEGDEILISIQEHHSNLVPWQIIAKEKKAVLKYIYLKEDGTLDYQDFLNKISDKTKVVGVTHVSNVLGFINPIEDIIKVSKEHHAITVIDGTQAVPHMNVDVARMDPDFYVLSGHKLLAPMGVGALYGRRTLLDEMPPFLYGGDMIDYVEEQHTDFAEVPSKYEGGTQNVEAMVGLKAAIDYLSDIGMDEISKHEQELVTYGLEKMSQLPHIKILGGLDVPRIGVISFQVEGVHPHDVASILDQDGICIRAGNHCAAPLLKYMGETSVCRASFYLYNSKEEIDFFVEKLQHVRRWLGYEA